MNEKFLTERSYSLQSSLLAVNINPFSKANFFLKDGVSILGSAFSHYFLVLWMTNCIASEKEHREIPPPLFYFLSDSMLFPI